MAGFMNKDIFQTKATERAEREKVLSWHTLPVDNVIYRIDHIDYVDSKFHGKLNAVLTLKAREKLHPVKVWAPGRLIDALQANPGKVAYVRTHGVTPGADGKSRFEFALAFE